jgi:Skp family chaperone for outer membrane proteins
MKRISFFTLAILALINLARIGNADFNMKLAVIDIQKIMNASIAYQDILKQLNQKLDDFKKSTSKIEQQLNEKRNKIETQRSVLSKEAHSEMVKEYQNSFERANKKAYEVKLQWDEVYQEAMTKIDSEIAEIVKKEALDKKLDGVLYKNVFAFFNDNKKELDITEEVANKLNKKISKLTIKFPENNIDIDSK